MPGRGTRPRGRRRGRDLLPRHHVPVGASAPVTVERDSAGHDRRRGRHKRRDPDHARVRTRTPVTAPMLCRLATMPGDPSRPNEDFAGVLGECAILLDGSGAPGDLPTGCIHGVPWYVRQLGSRCLAGMAAGEQDAPLGGILAAAIAGVSTLHRNTCDLSSPGTPSSVVIMTRAGAKSLDYLILGDSALVIEDGAGRTEVVTDKRMDRS